MCQIKLAAILVMPLAFLCSIATAQERQPGSPAKPSAATQLKPQTQLTPPVKTQPPQQVAGPHVSNVRPAQKMPTIAVIGADAPPTACPTPIYAVPPGDVYGPYVPYIPPPSACPTPTTPAALSSSSSV